MQSMLILTLIAVASAVLAPTLWSTARADQKAEFNIDNSVHINENCKEHCEANNNDIKQEGTIDYSNDGNHVTDVLNFYGKDLHGHEVEFTVQNLDTGAKLDKKVDN